MSNYYAQTLQMSFANTPVLIKKKQQPINRDFKHTTRLNSVQSGYTHTTFFSSQNSENCPLFF